MAWRVSENTPEMSACDATTAAVDASVTLWNGGITACRYGINAAGKIP